MWPLLAHWCYLAPATARLACTYGQAGLYFRRRALRDLDLPPTILPDPQMHRRWRHYFGGAGFLCAVFCQLRGKRLRPAEIRRVCLLAALAGFFDDLTDQVCQDDDSGNRWRDNPEHYGRTADSSGFALHILQKIYASLLPEHLKAFKQNLHRVFNIETAGRQRQGAPVDQSELGALTAEKGACSVLLFRLLLDHPLADAERRALSELGSLIQLADDMFDLWFDRLNGTVTLPTLLLEKNDLKQLQDLLERQVSGTVRAFRQLPVGVYRRESTLRTVHFLVSISRVCLRHYHRLQKKRGTLPLDNRKAMVVDMARSGHRGQTVWEVMMHDE